MGRRLSSVYAEVVDIQVACVGKTNGSEREFMKKLLSLLRAIFHICELMEFGYLIRKINHGMVVIRNVKYAGII